MNKLKPHTIEYRHMGKTYTMALEAESIEDAEARLRSAYESGDYSELSIGYEDEAERVRSARFNGEGQEVVVSLPVLEWFARAVS